MLIVGSFAQVFTGERTIDECNDIDIIASFDEVIKFLQMHQANGSLFTSGPTPNGKWIAVIQIEENKLKIVEFEISTIGSSSEKLIELNADKSLHSHPLFGDVNVATYTTQYMLKMSHRFLKNSSHFWKTFEDIKYLKGKGIVLTPDESAWLKRREDETYNYAHPSLMRSKDKFFNADEVKYVYDHDELHQVVKLYDKPAYEYFKAEHAEVFCSQEKFNALPDYIKIASVLEECWVLALERSQIPYSDKCTPLESFNMALQKVCTSISSGWWREYAWSQADHIAKLGEAYNASYYTKFLNAIKDGILHKKVNDE